MRSRMASSRLPSMPRTTLNSATLSGGGGRRRSLPDWRNHVRQAPAAGSSGDARLLLNVGRASAGKLLTPKVAVAAAESFSSLRRLTKVYIRLHPLRCWRMDAAWEMGFPRGRHCQHDAFHTSRPPLATPYGDQCKHLNGVPIWF